MTRADREAGFTLIELIVVLAIFGFMLALMIGRLHGPGPGITLRASANELAAGLREARSRAIAADVPTEIRLDLVARNWRRDGGAVHALPAAARISLITLTRDVHSDAVAGIRFEPDGSSSGGTIDLAEGDSRVEVGVDWLTGRVSVGNAR